MTGSGEEVAKISDQRRRPPSRLRASAFVFATLMVAALLIAGAASRAPGEESREKRPNVLILFADDQRADTIAAPGNPHIRTPHLDRLASQGTAFTRAYCMGSP